MLLLLVPLRLFPLQDIRLRKEGLPLRLLLGSSKGPHRGSYSRYYDIARNHFQGGLQESETDTEISKPWNLEPCDMAFEDIAFAEP